MPDPITPEEAIQFTGEIIPNLGTIAETIAPMIAPQMAAMLVAMDEAASSDCKCSPCQSFRAIRQSIAGY